MVANFAISNNTNSAGGRRQETLRKLAKEVIDGANQKERDVKQVIENRTEYFTTQYIPAETVIYSLSSQAYMNNNLRESLSFLNNKAAVNTLKTAPKHIYNEVEENVLFDIKLDDSDNIFAA